MKASLQILACFLLTLMLSGCAGDEDIMPSMDARVVDNAGMCGEGNLIEVTSVDAEGVARCGFGESARLYRVLNLPDDLKYEGATFTCQLEEIDDNMACIAIYRIYPAARITEICSKDTAPVVAAGK